MSNWKPWYQALRRNNQTAYNTAIFHAESLSLQYNLPMKISAELELSHIMLACEVLHITPETWPNLVLAGRQRSLWERLFGRRPKENDVW